MGLIRGVARTAVVAGTATAVSNRVSRRQANKWSGPGASSRQHRRSRQQRRRRTTSSSTRSSSTRLRRRSPPHRPRTTCLLSFRSLVSSKQPGVLTEEEFAAQKAKILAG